MKTIFKKGLALVAVFFMAQSTFAQFTFTASPGVAINGASFGYRFGKFIPQLGIDYMQFSGNYERNDYEYDPVTDEFVPTTYKYDYSIGAIMPRVGLKAFVAEKDNLKMYVVGGFMMPFLSGKSTTDGVNDYYIEDLVKGTKIWGADLAFGMEYFFNDRFSMSGQFGLRYLSMNNKDSYDQTQTNPNTGDQFTYQVKREWKNTASPTVTKVGLNFYF